MAAEKMYVSVDDIVRDWDVSKSCAYKILQRLNRQIREEHPDAIILSGKVSRAYYRKCCLADDGGAEQNGAGRVLNGH